MGISPMLDHLQQFYRLHSFYDDANPLDVIFPIPRETVLKIFASRSYFTASQNRCAVSSTMTTERIMKELWTSITHAFKSTCRTSASASAFSSEALPKDLVAEIKHSPGRISDRASYESVLMQPSQLHGNIVNIPSHSLQAVSVLYLSASILRFNRRTILGAKLRYHSFT